MQSKADARKSGKDFHTMISRSPVMAEMIKIIARVAKTDSSVLITGESGTGKELFAEQIHLRSSRNHAPFVRVNCAAIPEGLLESELFGHVRGAFTSAVSNRKGRFEMANGGTIFLDERGDMPLVLQAKLLRVIQEKEFEKVGSDNTITVDTRILAATNRNIKAMADKGEFRNDLYYRLNVVPLHVPPLRQRTEDIPDLARFFMSKYMRQNKKEFTGFSQDALEAILTYSWPGNIRELENCIERACVIAAEKWIKREDLLLNTAGTAMDKGRSARGGAKGGAAGGDRNLKKATNVFRINFIRKVLDENQWNQTETARSLDIQRTYLSRLMKDLNITRDKE
jgi:Nif-specific regulatory protein